MLIIRKEIASLDGKPERMQVREQLDIHLTAERFHRELANIGFEFSGFERFYFSELEEAQMAECLDDQRYLLGKILIGEEDYEEEYQRLMESDEVQGESGGVKVESRDNVTEYPDRIYTTCYYAGLPLNQVVFSEGSFAVQDFKMDRVPGEFIYLFPYFDDDGQLGWMEVRNSIVEPSLEFLYSNETFNRKKLSIDPEERDLLSALKRRIGRKRFSFIENHSVKGFKLTSGHEFTGDGTFNKRFMLGKRIEGDSQIVCCEINNDGSGTMRFNIGQYWDRQTYYSYIDPDFDVASLVERFEEEKFEQEPNVGTNVIASYVSDSDLIEGSGVKVFVDDVTVIGKWGVDVFVPLVTGTENFPYVIEAIQEGRKRKKLICMNELGLIVKVVDVNRGFPLSEEEAWAN